MNVMNPGPALTISDLEAFEREIDCTLPDDYRQFLLVSNGGAPELPSGVRWNGRIHEVPYFTALRTTSDRGLRRSLRNLQDLGIDEFLPIASTLNDDYLCLKLRDQLGSIALALIAYDDDVAVGASMFPLAGCFTELLNNLVAIPAVHCAVEALGKGGTLDDLAQYLEEGESLDAIGKNGMSILCESIKFDNLTIFNACLERGASLSGAMTIATINRRPDLIKTLYEAGADVNEQVVYGDRPLKHVCGTALPGSMGALTRQVRDLLISLGGID